MLFNSLMARPTRCPSKEKLEKLYVDKLLVPREMAHILKIRQQTVVEWLKLRGIPKRLNTKPTRAELAKMIERHSIERIALAFRTGVSNVIFWIQDYRLPHPELEDRHWGGYIGHSGYRVVYMNGKRNYLHRIIMERHLGRALSRDECVHHKNRNKLDNRLENLEILSNSEHFKITRRESMGTLQFLKSENKTLRATVVTLMRKVETLKEKLQILRTLHKHEYSERRKLTP